MKMSPHEVAHVALAAFTGIPGTDPRTGLPNMQLAVAIPSAESDYDTDAIATSSDVASANYGQTDHGLYQISGRWNAARYADVTAVTDGDDVMLRMQTRLEDVTDPVLRSDIQVARLVGMGDWRDPYDNARMARALFDEWWRKENAPAYMAEKRAQDPEWQPSGWGAWAVYNGGSAWKVTATAPKNRHLERARFGLTAPIPAPRPYNRRGGPAPTPDPLLIAVANLREAVDTIGHRMDDTTATVEAIETLVAEIRAVYRP